VSIFKRQSPALCSIAAILPTVNIMPVNMVFKVLLVN
jgi:hypothetical protein